MSDELKKILSRPQGELSQELLLKYLNEELSKDEQHTIEQHLLEDEFDNDVVEGLQNFEEKQRLAFIVDGLNRDLKKRTKNKSAQRKRLQLAPQWWLYFSVLILLIIIVLVYMYLHSTINR